MYTIFLNKNGEFFILIVKWHNATWILNSYYNMQVQVKLKKLV